MEVLSRISWKIWLALAAALIVGQAVTLYLMGQPAICECGVVKLWEGVVLGSGNSQHLTDWYTFSHVIHGLAFYLLLWLVFPKTPIGFRVALALGIEIGWEIFENTDFIINRYRETALAQGYVGDSVLNSVSDSFAMLGGFLMAWRLPIILLICLALMMEVFVGYAIRDNLTLNIVQLLHSFDFINNWQSGA